jgi:hypothetical protein
MSWDIQNSGKSSNLQVWKTNSGWWQFFRYHQDNFINIHTNKVLDISGGKDNEGQNVIVYNRHNGLNQRWRIVYVDTVKDLPRPEELREEWGMQCGKVFFLRTRMPSKRFVQSQSGNLAVGPKDFDKKNTEMQFMFDCKKNQITTADKSRAGQTWGIGSKGSSSNVEINGNGNEWYRYWHFNDGFIVNQRG